MKKEKIAFDKNIKSSKIELDKSLPKVSILHTGGTIASKVDYRTGGVNTTFTPQELMGLFPELNEKANVSTRLIANIWSEDIRYQEYNLLLDAIKEEIENGSQGIIIGHGTDTLHYSGAALQYALKNLPVPVLLVGSQRSSDRASSDAFSNLGAAIDFILKQLGETKQFRRVGICMHENISDENFLILDGINSKKMHSTRRDAFKQINYEPFAKLSYKNGDLVKYKEFREELKTDCPKEKLDVKKYNEELKIGFFKVHPNIFQDEIKMLEYYDAVVVEGTGIGNVPEHKNNLKKDGKLLGEFEKLAKKIKIIPAVQTVYGEVSLDIYSRGRDIQKAGFIGNRINLCSETLFIRAAFVLSNYKDNFDKIWKENLEGFEIRNEDIDSNI